MKGKIVTFDLPEAALVIRRSRKDERPYHPKFQLKAQDDHTVLVQDHALDVNGQPGFVLGSNVVCLAKRSNMCWIVAEVLLQDRCYYVQPKCLKPYKEPEANEQV